MHPRRFHPFAFLSLAGVLLLSILLSGCRAAAPTVVSGGGAGSGGAGSGGAENSAPTPTSTPAPPTATRTPLPTLPPTWTPKPNTALIVNTPTITPTFTATPDNRQTLAAATRLATHSPCAKFENAWAIRLANAWRPGWCVLDGDPISYYEYNLEFPSEWKVNMFGDRHPNLIFINPKPDIEVRLYQVYAYETENYTGSLEDAPAKARFCEKGGGCIPVTDPLDKFVRQEKRQLGTKDVLIVDALNGKRSVRRYFFMVNFFNTKPKSTRLFIVKVYTPNPMNAVLSAEAEPGEAYAEMMKQIEEMIVSLRPDTNRVMTPFPTAVPTK